MTKAEILAELPRLAADERLRFWSVSGVWKKVGPVEGEKRLLDEAQTAYDADASEGTPWR